MNSDKSSITDLILEVIPEAIAWKGHDMVYIGANTRFAKAVGLEKPEQVIGKRDKELPWSKFVYDHETYDKQVFEECKPIYNMVEFYHRKQEGDLWLEISRIPLLAADSSCVEKILIVFRDISKEMKAIETLEQKVEQRTKEISIAKDQAIEANKAKSQFLSRMSHELRTPLNAILGFSELMQIDYEEKHKVQSEELNEIQNAGRHLLHLINDVLDLAKIETGKLTISLEPVYVKTVVRECLKLSSTLALKHNVHLNTNMECTDRSRTDCCKTTVTADHLRLKQVLLNLITNAIKYNSENGFVTVTCQELENEGRVRILVEDTGIGIDENEHKKLFTAFERIGDEYTGIDGSGIGLVLSKNLAEEMGGSIGFDSQLGIGSQFWVDLPKAELTPGNMEAAIESEDPLSQSSNRTALYIEDNPSNQFLMTKIFNTCFPDWQLLMASEPYSGLDLAKSEQPDLILLDIGLPVMDGYAVFKELKLSELTSSIPVIAVTAHAMKEHFVKGKKIGFTDYISKPVNINRLARSINKLFPASNKGSGCTG